MPCFASHTHTHTHAYTCLQAVALEQALTGLDLRAEQAVVEEASRVAPPAPGALPQVMHVCLPFCGGGL